MEWVQLNRVIMSEETTLPAHIFFAAYWSYLGLVELQRVIMHEQTSPPPEIFDCSLAL